MTGYLYIPENMNFICLTLKVENKKEHQNIFQRQYMYLILTWPMSWNFYEGGGAWTHWLMGG